MTVSSSYVYTPPPISTVRPGFASRSARVLGVLQVVLGILFVLFQIVAIFLHAGFFFVGAGIWTGIVVIIAGSFGLASAQRKTNCTIITFMVMSIVGAIFVVCPMVLSCAGIAVDRHYYMFYEYDQHYSSRGGRLAVDSILFIVSLLQMIAAIWSSIVCCRATCCLPGGAAHPCLIWCAVTQNQALTTKEHDGYHVQYIASGAPQPMVLVAPPNAQPGVVYAVPPGQMAGPFIIQQGGGGVTMVPQHTSSRPIYNPSGSFSQTSMSNQPLLNHAQQPQYGEDPKV